jgi:hypothetical protein
VLMKRLVVAAVLLWSIGSVAEDCTVNVYRPKGSFGHIRMGVEVDGKKVAKLKDREQTTITIACGSHTFSTPSNSARWVFEFKPGTEYWLRVSRETAFVTRIEAFELVSPERAKAELSVAPIRASAATSTPAQ